MLLPLIFLSAANNETKAQEVVRQIKEETLNDKGNGGPVAAFVRVVGGQGVRCAMAGDIIHQGTFAQGIFPSCTCLLGMTTGP
jgi:hypothetical protein